MAYRGSTARVRAPLQARSRRRWLLVAGIAGLWLVFSIDLAGVADLIAPSGTVAPAGDILLEAGGGILWAVKATVLLPV